MKRNSTDPSRHDQKSRYAILTPVLRPCLWSQRGAPESSQSDRVQKKHRTVNRRFSLIGSSCLVSKSVNILKTNIVRKGTPGPTTFSFSLHPPLDVSSRLCSSHPALHYLSVSTIYSKSVVTLRQIAIDKLRYISFLKPLVEDLVTLSYNTIRSLHAFLNPLLHLYDHTNGHD